MNPIVTVISKQIIDVTGMDLSKSKPPMVKFQFKYLETKTEASNPKLIPKRTTDLSGIEDKVLSLYAKGMSQRDILDTMTDIYGFDLSHETISEITD